MEGLSVVLVLVFAIIVIATRAFLTVPQGFAFTLELQPGKPLVLQGDRGLSQKSDQPGNASIYYSLTRLPIAGAIVVAGVRHDVRGECGDAPAHGRRA